MTGLKMANSTQEKYLWDMIDVDMQTVSVCPVITVKAHRMLRTSRKGVENKTINITVLLQKILLEMCSGFPISITKLGELQRRSPNTWNDFIRRIMKLRLLIKRDSLRAGTIKVIWKKWAKDDCSPFLIVKELET